MICCKCVEKFDHHCIYINNCLGHRNHKYFLLFLVLITLYFLTSTLTTIASFLTHSGDRGDDLFTIIEWLIRIYTVIINALLAIPLVYQLKEQMKKLCKKEIIERSNTVSSQRSRHTSKASLSQNEFMKQSLLTGNQDVSSRGGVLERRGCCFNMKQLLCFRPVSQELLRAFLFSDSERYSTFILK